MCIESNDGTIWSVFKDVFVIQVDGVSCGPIACAKILHVFQMRMNRDSDQQFVDPNNINGWMCNEEVRVNNLQKLRDIITRFYDSAILYIERDLRSIYNHGANYPNPNEVDTKETCYCCLQPISVTDVTLITLCCHTRHHDLCLQSVLYHRKKCPRCTSPHPLPEDDMKKLLSMHGEGTKSSNDNSEYVVETVNDTDDDVSDPAPTTPHTVVYDTTPNETRKRQNEARAIDQKRQIKRMRKMARFSLSEITVGKAVNVEVDKREAANAGGILAVIYKKTNAGSAFVATQYGIIGSGNTKNDREPYAIPYEKYHILDDDIALPVSLENIRESIINKTFNVDDQPVCTKGEICKMIRGEMAKASCEKPMPVRKSGASTVTNVSTRTPFKMLVNCYSAKDRFDALRLLVEARKNFPFTVSLLGQLKWVKHTYPKRWFPCVVEHVREDICSVRFLILDKKCRLQFHSCKDVQTSSLKPFCLEKGCTGESCEHEWCSERVNSHLLYLESLAGYNKSPHFVRKIIMEHALLAWAVREGRKTIKNDSGELSESILDSDCADSKSVHGYDDDAGSENKNDPGCTDGDVMPEHVNVNELAPGDVISYYAWIAGPKGKPQSKMKNRMIHSFDLTQRFMACYNGYPTNDIDDVHVVLVAKWDGYRHHRIDRNNWRSRKMKRYVLTNEVKGGNTGRERINKINRHFQKEIASLLDGERLYEEAYAAVNSEDSSSGESSGREGKESDMSGRVTEI
jgi:hypothetical protein